MKTKIEDEAEFDEAIDQYGEALAKIERLGADAEMLKRMIESYANENGVTRHEAGAYLLTMTREKPALRRAAGVKEDDVVAELGRSETGKAYLVTTYDKAALKRDLAGNADGREQLAAYGLVLTDPQRHAVVKAV